MKRPESVHEMETRGRTQRRHTSKEKKETQNYLQDKATTDQPPNEGSPYAGPTNTDTDNDADTDAENKIHIISSEQLSYCYMILFREYVSWVPVIVRLFSVTSIIALTLFLTAFPESDKKSLFSEDVTLPGLYQKYPQHKIFWKAIKTSFHVCNKSDRPGVVLLLHNGNGSIADCLVHRTASVLSKLIGVSETGDYVYVDGRNAHQLFNEDSFLQDIMRKRQRHGVVIFGHLEQMNLQLVRSLHFICDNDPNIPGKAIIILMLNMEIRTSRDQNLNDLAETYLAKLWKEALKDRYLPIIGRINHNIASIDENIVTKCP